MWKRSQSRDSHFLLPLMKPFPSSTSQSLHVSLRGSPEYLTKIHLSNPWCCVLDSEVLVFVCSWWERESKVRAIPYFDCD